MRIISGSAKGKKLATFTGRDIRPTPDRVREAVFSILFSRVGNLTGKMILDLFAGTGAMGMEALSRGARMAWLVDPDPQSAKIITANLKACGLADRAVLIRADFRKALCGLKKEKHFDLVFLDPPYGRGLVPEVLAAVADFNLLAPGGIVCAESAAGDDVPDTVGDLERIDLRRYGSTAVHFFAYSGSEA